LTRIEARKLIRDSATTRLNAVDVSVLSNLISAVFLGQGKGATDSDLASRPANISIQTLAAKCGLKTEKAVCRHLRKLEAEGLITKSQNPQNLNKHVYTVHLEPMLKWERASTVLARQKKAKLAARREMDRAAYALKKAKQSQSLDAGAEVSSDNVASMTSPLATGG